MAHTRLVYVCGEHGCGRVVYASDEAKEDWLIRPRVDDPAVLLCRCPQHVTERTLRMCGMSLGKATWKKVEAAKARDKNLPVPPGLIIPLPATMIAALLAQENQ